MSEIISFEDTFQRLRQTYIERLRNSVEAIDNVLAQKQLAPLAAEDLRRAITLFHGLAGSGTTFGFPQVSEAALKIEIFLDLVIGSLGEFDVMSEHQYQTFEAMSQDLRRSCLRASEAGALRPQAVVAAEGTTGSNEEYSVLIVDDDDDLCNLLVLKFKEKGIEAEAVRSGEKALKILGMKRPDLVILDIMMPDMNGQELLRRLKQDPEFVSMPVIMLTGKTNEKDVRTAQHSGALDYIVKPFDPEALMEKVASILDSARRTILVADNDTHIAELLAGKYRSQGFRVITADNGVKAWNVIYRALPDLVVLDILMPGMDGLSVLANMRADAKTRNIPVIVVSTRSDKDQVDEGLEAGAQDYMIKPILTDDLVERTRKLLKTPVTAG
ncbi:MAG: two-component response regulator [Micavibrio sp.]|nr:two-component response regulator [Micavibrio sp.]